MSNSAQKNKFKVGDFIYRRGSNPIEIFEVINIEIVDSVHILQKPFSMARSFLTKETVEMRYDLAAVLGPKLLGSLGITLPSQDYEFRGNTCQHEYVTYQGLLESFDYCRHCDDIFKGG